MGLGNVPFSYLISTLIYTHTFKIKHETVKIKNEMMKASQILIHFFFSLLQKYINFEVELNNGTRYYSNVFLIPSTTRQWS